LVLAAVLGAPISAAAYWFLVLVEQLQKWIFQPAYLPNWLGFHGVPGLLTQSASYSVGALLLLMVCKGLAYGASLSGFRGGPTFPSMYIGAAGGIALSHLPGLQTIPGAAMGIGAMCAVMLRLPLTSVLLATLFLLSDGMAVMPLVIVAVVVAHVLSARLVPLLASAELQPDRKSTTEPMGAAKTPIPVSGT
jgi:H+/Cl- antiporter ClcA